MDKLQKRREQIITLKNSEEFKSLNAYYRKKSFFNILGISRKETIHSYFLHWLFSADESHELGTHAIRKLLEVLVLVKNKLQSGNSQLLFPADIEDIIICGSYSLSHVTAEREHAISDGFLDVFITFDFISENIHKKLNIIIENKVKSKEGDRQTWRYYHYGQGLAGETIYVFLTPLSNREFEMLPEPACECKKFIGLNYQYLVNYVLEPCRNECGVKDAQVFIEEYLRTLSQPSLQYNERERGEIIMAIGEKERELLLNFWQSNKDLLIAALTALSDDPDLEEMERASINAGLNAVIKSSNKDYSKYVLDGEIYSKRKLAYAIVSKYVKEHPVVSFHELQRVFPKELQGTIGTFDTIENALSREEGYRHFSKNDEVLSLKDANIAVCNQWGSGNIKHIIRVAKQLGYDVEQQNHTEEIRDHIRDLFDKAKESGQDYIDILAKDVEKAVSDDQHVPSVCSAMRSLMKDGDEILKSPPKGNGVTLLIRYYLD